MMAETDTICAWCDEPAEGEVRYVPHAVGTSSEVTQEPYHNACFIRMIAGGLNHQRKVCSCYGGVEPNDPVGLTKRQAALVSYAYQLGVVDTEDRYKALPPDELARAFFGRRES